MHRSYRSDKLFLKENAFKEKFYHIFNRGNWKNKIFIDKNDYLRFIYSLYIFNSRERVGSLTYRFLKKSFEVFLEKELKYFRKEECGRKCLVNILAFVLMPDHFHLFVESEDARNLSLFVKKISGSYSLYFNKKYCRSGFLFESKYKSILVDKKDDFLNLLCYLHYNPLVLKEKENLNDIEFLNTYQWSSHIDFCGWNNFPSLLKKDFLWETFGNPEKYKLFFNTWLRNRKNICLKLKEIILEEPNAIF
jgi:REP element-mobilizing transposase RayT